MSELKRRLLKLERCSKLKKNIRVVQRRGDRLYMMDGTPFDWNGEDPLIIFDEAVLNV